MYIFVYTLQVNLQCYIHSLGARYRADEGRARQVNLEVNLISGSSLIGLDHVGDRPTKLLGHEEALDVKGELTLIGLARGKLEGNLDALVR